MRGTSNIRMTRLLIYITSHFTLLNHRLSDIISLFEQMECTIISSNVLQQILVVMANL